MKLAVCALLMVAAQAAEFDLVIRNARLVDGTGAPWFRADLAVKGGRIAKIARHIDGTATEEIDAKDRVLAPGFIDVHTHIEGSIGQNPAAENFVRDGVTTVITGNCGSSELEIAAWFKELDTAGLGINVATLVGHNSVRGAVMGTANRNATREEIAQMKALVEKAMREGAVGFSTGLEYVPGAYAPREEIVELAKVAARFNGVYASHMRYEGEKVLEAMEEALAVGREAKIRVEISHLKQDTRRFWGTSDKMIALLDRARAEGIDVTADQYPYDHSATSLAIRLPAWALADGKLKDRLANPATKAEIVAGMKRMVESRAWGDYGFATVVGFNPDPSYVGKTIPEITKLKGREPSLDNQIEAIFDLMLAGGARMVYLVMSEADIERILRWPATAIASDGGGGIAHPRSYGTNARILAHYAHILPLEEAIRRMTSLPARTFNLRDRGLLREGFGADLVLFDPAKVRDVATYKNPREFSTGFDLVLVNGGHRGHPIRATPGPSRGSFDLVIRNARVLDGSVNPWFRADVGVRDGRIAAIGSLGQMTAARTINAGGRILAPGFIDIHTHIERAIEKHPDAANFLRDGVTSVVTGNCGGSQLEFTFPTSSLRISSLVGHNTIREKVMGRANRAATPEELARMKALVAEAMRNGAVGFSTGLEYVPGAYAPSEEVIELARVACRAGGVYATHMRDEGEKVLDAMHEAIRVGREAGCPVEISHLKQDVKRLWGTASKQLDLIAEARREGIDVAADQYPYDAYSTGLSFLLPAASRAEGAEMPRDQVIREAAATVRGKGYEDLAWVRIAQWPQRVDWEGLTVSEIHQRFGRPPGLENEIGTLLDLIERGATSGVYKAMSEDDIETIMRSPFVAVASDGAVVAPGEGRPHPRSYGTNARILSRYVREKHTVRLEEAIHKMTALPARAFLFLDRGLLYEGAVADLVLFDPAEVAAPATFDNPHQYATGLTVIR